MRKFVVSDSGEGLIMIVGTWLMFFGLGMFSQQEYAVNKAFVIILGAVIATAGWWYDIRRRSTTRVRSRMKVYIPPKYNKEGRRQVWFVDLGRQPYTDIINGALFAFFIAGWVWMGLLLLKVVLI